jgi:hypothetical protein
LRIEVVAARLIDSQLRTESLPEELFTTDEEAEFYGNAVRQFREDQRKYAK